MILPADDVVSITADLHRLLEKYIVANQMHTSESTAQHHRIQTMLSAKEEMGELLRKVGGSYHTPTYKAYVDQDDVVNIKRVA